MPARQDALDSLGKAMSYGSGDVSVGESSGLLIVGALLKIGAASFHILHRGIESQRLAHLDARSEEHSLNSSHSQISYAVFCLKKKKKQTILTHCLQCD